MFLTARGALVAAALPLAWSAGCGGKTGLAIPSCEADAECDDGLACNGLEVCDPEAGRCRRGEAVDCDDGDPCTVDACLEPAPGETTAARCESTDVRVDADGDGFDALQPDFPEECGTDCVDTDPEIFPGAPERCNGLDDDCDVLVDEGASFEPETVEQRLTFDALTTTPGGLAWSAATETWGVIFTTTERVAGGGNSVIPVFFLELDVDGAPLGDPERVLLLETIALGPRIAAGGDATFGVVWPDRRIVGEDYELWFNRLTPTGQKLGPDLRLTVARGKSTRPSMVWTGAEWAVAWQDEREVPQSADLYMTFLDRDGFEIGDDRRLTDAPGNTESPELALGDGELGVVFTDTRNDPDPFDAETETQVFFLVTDLDGRVLEPERPLSALAPRTGAATVAYADGAFLVAWEERNAAGDTDVVGVRIPRDGGAVEGPFTLAGGPDFAREPELLVVGETVVLVFSDDRGEPPDFAQWVALFDPSLVRIRPDARATFGAASSTRGSLAPGDLTVGLVYEDRRDVGFTEAYFTRLLCVDPGDVE